MNAIVHYPQSNEDLENFKKRVSKINADAIIYKINHMPCSFDQKISLINTVQHLIKVELTKNEYK